MIAACRPSNSTSRQRLIELLTGTLLSSHQLAPLLGIPERQVEEHLTHIVKTIARDPSRTLLWNRRNVWAAGSPFVTGPG